MKYRETIDYPIPSDDVFRHFRSQDFFLRKYAELGAKNLRINAASFDEKRLSITVTREVPVEVEIPAFARSKVPSHITLVQTNTWDIPARRGQLEIRFRSLPVHVNCAMRMEDVAAGARQTLDFDLRVNVPLIGGRLEEVLARDLRLKFRKDTEVSLRLMGCSLNDPSLPRGTRP